MCFNLGYKAFCAHDLCLQFIVCVTFAFVRASWVIGEKNETIYPCRIRRTPSKWTVRWERDLSLWVSGYLNATCFFWLTFWFLYLRAETTGRPSDLCGAIIPIRLHETGCHTESVLKSLPLYGGIDLRLAEKVVKKRQKNRVNGEGHGCKGKHWTLKSWKVPKHNREGTEMRK